MKPLIVTLISAFLFSACLTSPLLEHENASEQTSTKNQPKADPKCPLKFETLKLCASLEWTKAFSEDEKGEFIVQFWKQDKPDNNENGKHDLVDPGHTVFVKLWMPSMGHGSSPVRVSSSKDEQENVIVGSFIASEVHFVMGGAWEIWVQLKDKKKVLDQAKVDFEI